MSAIAIILARAGSRGLPGKNVAPVAGRPCVAWTIEAAMNAETVSEVVVSSDDDRVLEIAGAMGATAERRPDELAGPEVTVDAAARHAVRGHAGDPVVILYANVPVRPEGLIDRAVRKLDETGADSVQSYAPVGKHHPWWTTRIDERTGRVAAWDGGELNHGVFRRQDLPTAFIPDGGVIAVRRAALRLEHVAAGNGEPGPHAFLGPDRRGIETRTGAVVDIDDRIDLQVADAVLRERLAQSGRGQTTSIRAA